MGKLVEIAVHLGRENPETAIMPTDYFGFGYALTVAAGGIMGYVKAASLPSLAAGLAFGSMAGLGAYHTTQNPSDIRVMTATSAALGVFMGYRFYNSQKFMPAGLITAISVLMFLKCGYSAMNK